MSVSEAYRHTLTLAADPSSRLAAALGGWTRPVTHAELVLMDVIDQAALVAWGQAGGKGRRPKPYPRPWPEQTSRRTKPTVSQEQVIEALRFAGHTKPIPTRG